MKPGNSTCFQISSGQNFLVPDVGKAISHDIVEVAFVIPVPDISLRAAGSVGRYSFLNTGAGEQLLSRQNCVLRI